VPLPTFSALVPATLASRRDVARDQIELLLEVPPSLRARHERPGQFVKVAVTGEDGLGHEGVFAMWNAPHDAAPTLRFLLRTNNPEGGEAAARLATMPLGSAVLVSEPAGSGFDLGRAKGRHLAFVATGTAIAPVHAGIEHALGTDVGALDLSLDLGLRSPEHLASRSDLEHQRTRGLEVHLHYSEPSADGTVVGTLAHEALLARLGERGTVKDTFVVAVGQPAMVKELRARLVSLGGEAEDVVSNY
jgi:NAD(P)H-flavin reductase